MSGGAVDVLAVMDRDAADAENYRRDASPSSHYAVAGVAESSRARAAVAELIEADREYDAALAAYNACESVRPWHSPAVTRELAGYRRNARERLNAAKARRVAALARVGGAK